ncbi:MAG: tetratricopeptide repeat protein, partial [Actinobacteria bacterium]|nr:tetratricopeptide repeat protein [Actinomycetota bacterium]
MSPQLRESILGLADTYSAFKADVFSLGMTVYAMASLTSPYDAWPIVSLERTARANVGALECCETLKGLLLTMLLLRETDRPDMQTVLECANIEGAKYDLARAQEMKAAGDYHRALELLQRVGRDSAEVCVLLGQVYSHFGRWTEAEAVLTQGLHLPSDLTVQLRNAHCELSLSGGKGPTFERQKALYYLARSHYKLGDGLGRRQVDKWTEVLVSDTPQTKCLTLLITADRQRIKGSTKEAVSGYEEGLELARKQCADSLFTASSTFQLAFLYSST